MGTAVSLLAAWPFGYAGMLFWTAAAAAPILIHLWSRRRRQEVRWAATRFLQAALRRHSRRLQLEQLLLLAMRVLLLVLFALALADPYLPWQARGGRTRGSKYWILVLDASYSMGDSQQPDAPLAVAKEAARRLAATAASGDAFSLVVMGDPPRVAIGKPTLDPQAVLAEMDRIQRTDGGARLSGALAAIDRLVRSPEVAGNYVIEVHLFSDLTVPTWRETRQDGCRQQIAALDERASLQLHDVGVSDQGSNLAVTGLRRTTPFVVAGEDLLVEAEVHCFGGRGTAAAELQWLVDGRQLHRQPLRIAAEATQVVQFRVPLGAAGEHLVAAKLAPADRIAADNLRQISLPARQQLRVLCVAGKHNAARPAALALAPSGPTGLRLQVDTASESALLDRSLRDYDCVVLCNVGRFGEDEAQMLFDFVSAGGGLIVFPGDQTQLASYNTELFERHPLLPARLVKATAAGQQGVDPLDFAHPIAQPFAGHESAGLRSTPVWRYFELAPAADARVALRLSGGGPLLVERQVGNGRCLLAATAASPESTDEQDGAVRSWSDLSVWPSFLPLLQESVVFCLSGRSDFRNRLVGEPFVGEVAAASEAQVFTPDGAPRRLALQGQRGAWSFADTRQSGVYRLQYQAAGETAEQLYVANVDTAESNPQRVAVEDLPSQLRMATANGDQRAPVARRWLFRWLLGAVFSLLLLESWFSSRRGSGAV